MEEIFAPLSAKCVPVAQGQIWSFMSPEGIQAQLPRPGRRVEFNVSCDTHSVLSPRNSLRKAGQRKRENQLFFCATVIFVVLLGSPGGSALTRLMMLTIQRNVGVIVAYEQPGDVLCAVVVSAGL